MCPGAGLEGEILLDKEVENQAGEEGDRGGDPQIDAAHLMEESQESEVDGEGKPSHHEELNQVAVAHNGLHAVSQAHSPIPMIRTNRL